MMKKIDSTKNQVTPTNWGKDSLSEFFSFAQENMYATYVQQNDEYNLISQIDSFFYKTALQMNQPKHVIPAFLLIRSHSSFRCACQIVTQTQIPESYVMLRNTLEHALYAFHIRDDKEREEIWLSRNERKSKMKDTFQIGPIIKSIKDTDTKLHNDVSTLYERCIDYGAHPNPQAMLTNIKMTEVDANTREYSHTYFAGGGVSLSLSLRTTAQIGICTLLLFEKIFPERFELLGVTDFLRKNRLKISTN